ncbi:hypothetical protein [Herbaspirillum sp. RV1423]|uniref:hypothetical protein n=1 Tax=Herbaspirillum sp. RV1423 TaxID=1443993 RepID=UPI0006884E65|nr:hypothetical protein [Herbaspirillum sp. RV1423]
MSTITGFSNAPITGNVPSVADMNAYSAGLKDQKTDALLSKLADPSTEQWQKDAINKELQNRVNTQSPDGANAAGGQGGSGSEMDELLKKLQKGTISDEELQKLAQMLGVDPAKLEAIKGKDGGGQAPVAGEIQGG